MDFYDHSGASTNTVEIVSLAGFSGEAAGAVPGNAACRLGLCFFFGKNLCSTQINCRGSGNNNRVGKHLNL